MHPYVRGELACGNLHKRIELLKLFDDLPFSAVATDNEVMFYIEKHKLMGRSIDYVDAHLLAATSLTQGTKLWTKDKVWQCSRIDSGSNIRRLIDRANRENLTSGNLS